MARVLRSRQTPLDTGGDQSLQRAERSLPIEARSLAHSCVRERALPSDAEDEVIDLLIRVADASWNSQVRGDVVFGTTALPTTLENTP